MGLSSYLNAGDVVVEVVQRLEHQVWKLILHGKQTLRVDAVKVGLGLGHLEHARQLFAKRRHLVRKLAERLQFVALKPREKSSEHGEKEKARTAPTAAAIKAHAVEQAPYREHNF